MFMIILVIMFIMIILVIMIIMINIYICILSCHDYDDYDDHDADDDEDDDHHMSSFLSSFSLIPSWFLLIFTLSAADPSSWCRFITTMETCIYSDHPSYTTYGLLYIYICNHIYSIYICGITMNNSTEWGLTNQGIPTFSLNCFFYRRRYIW